MSEDEGPMSRPPPPAPLAPPPGAASVPSSRRMVPTLTEVIPPPPAGHGERATAGARREDDRATAAAQRDDERATGAAHREDQCGAYDAAREERRGPHGDRRALAAFSEAVTERVLHDLQRRVDVMLEQRLREALLPILARLTEPIVESARAELARAMKSLVSEALAAERARAAGDEPLR